jgi:hypothetical protein
MVDVMHRAKQHLSSSDNLISSFCCTSQVLVDVMHITRLNEVSSSDKSEDYQNSFTISILCFEMSHTNSKWKAQPSRYHDHHAKYSTAVAELYTKAQRLGLITWAIEPAVASSSISQSELCGLDE